MSQPTTAVMEKSSLEALANDNVNRNDGDGSSRCYIKARHVVAFMGFMAKFCVYSTRVNLSVAIVAMANFSNNEARNSSQTFCPDLDQSDHSDSSLNGVFDWNSAQQGLLLGCYYYGYLTSNVPGGYFSRRWGVRMVVGACLLLSSVVTLLTPPIAFASYELLVASRIVLGVFHGAISSGLYTAWGSWAPPLERSNLVGVTTSGGSFGILATLPLAGLIADRFGWEAVFYATGGLSLWIAISWIVIIRNSPADHPRISGAERSYIENSIGKKTKVAKVRTPWTSMLRSAPVWAITLAHFTNLWGQNTMMAMLPTYMSSILRFSVFSAGVASALPYVLQFFAVVGSGYASDIILKRRYATITTVRKVNTVIGLLGPAIFIVLAGYIGCDVAAAVTFFCISVALSGFTVPGCEANSVDVAPKYGGIIYGIANTFANTSGFLAPQIIGLMLIGDATLTQWQNVFWMTGGVNCFGILFYVVFASGVQQPWAHGSAIDDSEEDVL